MSKKHQKKGKKQHKKNDPNKITLKKTTVNKYHTYDGEKYELTGTFPKNLRNSRRRAEGTKKFWKSLGFKARIEEVKYYWLVYRGLSK